MSDSGICEKGNPSNFRTIIARAFDRTSKENLLDGTAASVPTEIVESYCSIASNLPARLAEELLLEKELGTASMPCSPQLRQITLENLMYLRALLLIFPELGLIGLKPTVSHLKKLGSMLSSGTKQELNYYSLLKLADTSNTSKLETYWQPQVEVLNGRDLVSARLVQMCLFLQIDMEEARTVWLL